jgi:hypothetical protein
MIAGHFAALGIDDDRAAEIYAADAVLEYPQSRERIRGKAHIVASRKAYPGRPITVELVRSFGAGDIWTSEWILRYEDDEPHVAIKIHEFRDGRVVRERIYIAEPWEPPAYRAQWVEPITD